jgi:hypothetical protein
VMKLHVVQYCSGRTIKLNALAIPTIDLVARAYPRSPMWLIVARVPGDVRSWRSGIKLISSTQSLVLFLVLLR